MLVDAKGLEVQVDHVKEVDAGAPMELEPLWQVEVLLLQSQG